ncbi:SRPBCC family protein [Actinomadura sp. 6N118]|uniref:SRPBCC family protein n=1 Tax=Actinomadura sp. 6N118 TaxID=3375151 RepID=UPI0037B0D55B
MTTPMRLRARVEAPGKDVHQALTDATAMRIWLAEKAEVELPTRYEFWGRYTPEGDVPRQRLLHVDERTLRYTWTLDGQDTTVEFSIADESPGSSILTLSQTDLPTLQESIEGHGSRHVMHTHWAMYIANLVDHLEGREITMRCDFTSPEMREQLVIDAPRSAVYDSLIDPSKFRRWFGANIDIEPHVGGRVAMGGFELDPDPQARILELEPDRKCTIQWHPDMVSSWELEDSEGKTRLTFVQSGFDDGRPDYGSWLGWMSGVAELRRFHELKDWRPIWLEVEVEGMPEGMLYSESQ